MAETNTQTCRRTTLATAACLTLGFAGRLAAADGEPALSWQNERLSVSWASGDATVRLENRATGESISIPVGIDSIEFDTDRLTGFCTVPGRPTIINAAAGQSWRFAWPVVAVPRARAQVRCTAEFHLHSAQPVIRKKATVELLGDGGPVLLKEVVIDSLDLKGQGPRQPFDGWQSYPVLCESFFCGVEFPAAQAAVRGDTARLFCRPGRRLTSGDRYDVWPVVYGVSAKGRTREAFEAYIDALRPKSAPLHIQYNSWWSAPFPFTENQMLDLVGVFREDFFKPFGGRLDSFCLDMGWADWQALWKLNPACFPRGFGPLTSALGEIGAGLALWCSPSSCYPYPGALDSHWAWRNGYETFLQPNGIRCACLAGRKYATAYRDSLVDLTRRYRIAHFKFDGYVPTCPETDHGHEPGELSAEKTACGIIDVFKAVRAENPTIWLEPTCFGFRPSPWWMMYVDSMIGTFGDDAPPGRIPCPVYRESYTTARDYYNLQGAKDILAPIHGQEVLGIIHQTPEPLQNDAVVTVLRGHGFIPLYINPRFMNARRWRFLANLLTWARTNGELLRHTKVLCFGGWADEKRSRAWDDELPRDVYGYAHFAGGAGAVLLRNPWIRPARVELVLDESAGGKVPPDCGPAAAEVRPPVGPGSTPRGMTAACLYPKFGRLAGTCSPGNRVTVELGPFETMLLAFGDFADAPPLPPRRQAGLAVSGIEWIISQSHDQVRFAFDAGGGAPDRQLWVLSEAKTAFQAPDCAIRVNGRTVAPRVFDSTTGWRASGADPHEQWFWHVVDLPAGDAKVEAELLAQDEARVSAWLVERELVTDDPSAAGPIPPPEERWLDAAEVLAPIRIGWAEPAGAVNVAMASQGAMATASSAWSAAFGPEKAIDGKDDTRWNSRGGDVAGAWLVVDFGRPRRIATISFREAAGGRIEQYKLQRWDKDAWVDVVSTCKAPNKATVRHRFPPVETTRIRLLIVTATEVPTIYEIEAK